MQKLDADSIKNEEYIKSFFSIYEANDFTFYRIPKMLVTNPNYKRISYGAKLLYGLLLDRMSLSQKNSWGDEFGRAYVVYSIEEIMEDLACSKQSAVTMMKELELIRLIELDSNESRIYVKIQNNTKHGDAK